jgi:hypothetical protein
MRNFVSLAVKKPSAEDKLRPSRDEQYDDDDDDDDDDDAQSTFTLRDAL